MLVIIYGISVAIIVPYAFGYRFSITRGVFVHAGALTVAVAPHDATISIDDRPLRGISFINDAWQINGIPPGEHVLTIAHEGYQTWRKRVRVRSGISTEFWNVLLPRTQYTPLQRAQIEAVAPTFVAPDLTHTATMTPTTITITPLRKDADQPLPAPQVIALPDEYFTLQQEQNIEWSPRGNALLIPVRTADETNDVLIVDRNRGAYVTLRTLFPNARRIALPRWDPHNTRAFYVIVNDVLQRVTLPTQLTDIAAATTSIVAQDIFTYTIAKDTVYYVSTRDRMIYAIRGDHQEAVTPQSAGTVAHNSALVVYDDERLTIRTDGTLELFNRGAWHVLRAHDIRGSAFSDDGKKLLFWSNHEINVYFLRDWHVQPQRRAGETITIARFAAPLTAIQWAHDYEHVFFVTDNALKITALDHRDGHMTFTLLRNISPPSTIIVTPNTLFIRSSDTLLSIPFPDDEAVTPRQ